ncbi:MAG: phosphotransferase family protein, partial [Planctomycetota bacterium]
PLDPARRVRARRSSATLLRYKPERRAVLRLDLRLTGDDAGELPLTIAARALPPTEASRVARARAASVEPVRAGPDWIAPRLLHVEERTGIILEEWVDSETLGERPFDHAHATGAILARLHALPTPAGMAPTSDAPSSLQALLEIDERLWAKARELSALPAAQAVSWIHGDLHPDQIVRERASGQMRLLDLDAIGIGDPARDLATWIADHLAGDARVGFEAARRPLLDGYRESGGSAPADEVLARHVAFQLVSMAASAVRRLERSAVARAESLLARAADVFPPRRVRA